MPFRLQDHSLPVLWYMAQWVSSWSTSCFTRAASGGSASSPCQDQTRGERRSTVAYWAQARSQ